MIEYTVQVYDSGNTFWFKNGESHREGDKPASEYSNGDKYWYINGIRHRENGAAIIRADGDQFWYLNGEELTEEEHAARTQPAKELTVADIEKLLGHKVKVIK